MEGNIVFYGYLGSIDEMKEAQIKLVEAKEEAERANKAKSEFLANMSHEIRTPLNAVLGFSELLKGNTKEPKYEKYIDGVLTGGKNLLSLINDILDLSKIEAGFISMEIVPVNIGSLVGEFKQLFSQRAEEKKVEFAITLNDTLPKNILIDETRFRQILFNLLGNAFKFTDSGRIELDVDYTISDNLSGNIDLICKVKDSGIGIPKDQQALIFEAFKQQDGQSTRKYGGTGLGLSITKRLVDVMKGSILLESESGKGSVFTVTIKNLSIAVVEEEVELINGVQEFNFKGQTILLVEDIASNREVVCGFLERINLRVDTAQNGQEAIDMLEQVRPDLILMDMMMPVLDGYSATKIIRTKREYDNVPILALTASALKHSEEDIRNLCNDYLRKPISKIDLMQALAKYLEHDMVVTASESESMETILDKGIFEQDLKTKLNNRFHEYWKNIAELMSIDDIQSFSTDLLIFATEENSSELKEYARRMKEYADNFEIEKMNLIFLRFNDLIK